MGQGWTASPSYYKPTVQPLYASPTVTDSWWSSPATSTNIPTSVVLTAQLNCLQDSSPSAPRLPPHPESLLTFDIAIGGKEHASTLSESFGRFVDLPAPGSPRECHGLGNLRGDEAWGEERNGQGLTSEQNNVKRRTGAYFRVWNGGEERSRRVGRPITYGGSVETAGRGRSEGPGSANGGGGETADPPRNEAGGETRGPRTRSARSPKGLSQRGRERRVWRDAGDRAERKTRKRGEGSGGVGWVSPATTGGRRTTRSAESADLASPTVQATARRVVPGTACRGERVTRESGSGERESPENPERTEGYASPAKKGGQCTTRSAESVGPESPEHTTPTRGTGKGARYRVGGDTGGNRSDTHPPLGKTQTNEGHTDRIAGDKLPGNPLPHHARDRQGRTQRAQPMPDPQPYHTRKRSHGEDQSQTGERDIFDYESNFILPAPPHQFSNFRLRYG